MYFCGIECNLYSLAVKHAEREMPESLIGDNLHKWTTVLYKLRQYGTHHIQEFCVLHGVEIALKNDETDWLPKNVACDNPYNWARFRCAHHPFDDKQGTFPKDLKVYDSHSGTRHTEECNELLVK